MGHDAANNPTMTVVFEQRGVSNTPFQTLLCLAKDSTLEEIKQLLSRSTLKSTGCQLHTDTITVHKHPALVHGLIVRWHINLKSTTRPISDQWLESLFQRLRAEDSTHVLIVQWNGNASYIGVQEYTKIADLMDMVSCLTNKHLNDFCLEAQSGWQTAQTFLGDMDLAICNFVNLDHRIVINMLQVTDIDTPANTRTRWQ
jgi:hypothetical protein